MSSVLHPADWPHTMEYLYCPSKGVMEQNKSNTQILITTLLCHYTEYLILSDKSQVSILLHIDLKLDSVKHYAYPKKRRDGGREQRKERMCCELFLLNTDIFTTHLYRKHTHSSAEIVWQYAMKNRVSK